MGKEAVIDSGKPYNKSLSGYFDSMTKRWTTSPSGFLSGVIKPFIMFYANRNYFNDIVKMLPSEEKELIKGMAHAYDGYEFEIQRAFMGNEMTNVIYAEGDFITPLNPSRQCSSFAISGKFTSNGKRLFGRNLDYPGIGYKGAAFSVYLLKPKTGYRQLVVAPTGVPTSGTTGMNEKGLTVVLHMAFSRIVNKQDATPIMSISREVLTKASSIEEALKIIKTHKVISAWMLHLTDRDKKTGKARSAIVELSASGIALQDFRSDETPTVLTNHFRTEVQQANEYFFYGGDDIHNHERLERLTTLSARPKQTLEDAVSILRDSHSLTSNQPMIYYPGSIRTLDQLASVVFSPDDLKMYVAYGIAPASYGKFYEFSFDQMENNETPSVAVNEIPRDAGLQGYTMAFAAQLELLSN